MHLSQEAKHSRGQASSHVIQESDSGPLKRRKGTLVALVMLSRVKKEAGYKLVQSRALSSCPKWTSAQEAEFITLTCILI